MSRIKKSDGLGEEYEEQYDDLKPPVRRKHTKFKKKISRWGKKFNKQSDYRKRARKKR